MIITRTPYRISFFGGGTDYPDYYRENGGAVLVTSINRYIYISVRKLPPFFDFKYRVVWSRNEMVNGIDDIVHPSVRECLRRMGIQEGMEIHYQGDLPARAGLGSSSSFTVGLLNALHAYKGERVTKMALSEEAIHMEQKILQENVGSQDQTATALGGLNIIRFNCNGGQHMEATPLCLTQERTAELERHLMLFFTGFARTASDIAGAQIEKIPKIKCELGEMGRLVDTAAEILGNGADLDDFGRLLHENWQLKRSLSDKISSTVIDEIYDLALSNGAIGGKLLGAGGGGFILFYVKPEYQQQVRQALNLLHVPFRLEFSGSHVIFYDPDTDEAAFENSNGAGMEAVGLGVA